MNTGARIELPQGLFDIEIFDQTGARVRSMPGSRGVVMIERGSLVTGVYHVRVSNETTQKYVRLIVE
jgi:hypothetical protein